MSSLSGVLGAAGVRERPGLPHNCSSKEALWQRHQQPPEESGNVRRTFVDNHLAATFVNIFSFKICILVLWCFTFKWPSTTNHWRYSMYMNGFHVADAIKTAWTKRKTCAPRCSETWGTSEGVKMSKRMFVLLNNEHDFSQLLQIQKGSILYRCSCP